MRLPSVFSSSASGASAAAFLLVIAGLTPPAPGQDRGAEVLRRRLDAGEAREVLAEVIAGITSGTTGVDEALIGSEAALVLEEWNHARSLADLAAAKAPKDWRGHMANGHALFRMAEAKAGEARGGGGLIRATFSDSATSYRLARELGAPLFETACFEAEARLMAFDLADGIAAVDRALAAVPDSRHALVLKARLLTEQGGHAEAMACLEAARRSAPADPEPARLLMRAALAAGADRPRVRALFLDLVRAFPEDSGIYDAFITRFWNERPEAFLRGVMEEILAGDPAKSLRFPLWCLGALDERAGRLEDALARYVEYRDRRPTAAEGELHVGWVLTALGRLAEARQALLRANALGGLAPEDMVRGLGRLIGAHVERREFEPAARLQQVVHSLLPSPEAERDLAVLEYGAGRRAEGLEIYRRLLARDDLDLPARAKTENYAGLALLGMGRAGEAEACFRRSLDLIDDTPDALDARENLGAVLLDSGRREEAGEHLAKVVLAAPERTRARYHLLRARHPEILGVKRP